jgi:hypothetical protein
LDACVFSSQRTLRNFPDSSTAQDVGIICQQSEEEFSGCEPLLHVSQTFFNWHSMCIYRPRDTTSKENVTQAKRKGAHMVESTWRELCKKIMDEKDPRRLMTLVEALNKELGQREQELQSRRQQFVAKQ